MFFIGFFALLGVLLFGFCFWMVVGKKAALPRRSLALLFLAALFLRLLAAALSKGFGSDTACFAAWADRVFQLGPGGFYSPDVFTDYPPGYMYMLWLVGGIRQLFSLEYYSVPHLILLKLPAISCDMACGLLIYREACKKGSEHQGLFLCMAYLFNPAVFLNSSVWGQVDSVFTLALAYMCICLVRGKLPTAYIAFGIGVLIKPQMLVFAPVLLAGIIDWVFLKDFTAKKFFHHLFLGTAAILGMVILCMPFGLENVWNQYFSTLASYPYAAVNAYNFWGLLGLNWVSQENTFLGIPYRTYGAFAIVAAVVLAAFMAYRRRDKEKYPILGAVLILTVFSFSVRMHERYMYPGLFLLLLAYIYRPKKQIYLCYGIFSVLHFLNTAHVVFFYDPSNYDRTAPFLLAVSGGFLLGMGLLYYTVFRVYGLAGRRAQEECETLSALPFSHEKNSPSGSSQTGSGRLFSRLKDLLAAGQAPCATRKYPPLKPVDFLCMFLITALYSCFALYDLGDRQAPSTTYDMVQEQVIELSFPDKAPSVLWYYMAPWHNRNFSLEGRSSFQEQWTPMGEITLKNVFTWQQIPLDGTSSQLRFTLKDNQASILEWVFLDDEGNVLTPMAYDFYGNLFDENELFPDYRPAAYSSGDLSLDNDGSLPADPSSQGGSAGAAVSGVQVHPEAGSFRNSMYFDEIYHGRTAYEFLHGLTSYENTHPPMGKIFIALGISLFGMNPFGWRIIGTLFGIAMVPVIYLFARRICKSTVLSSLACLLFAFDFMHFTQTRIATIDVYITFFVILMYYFMYQYSTLSFYDTPLKKTWLPLGACGVCMGLGIASKWTGVYAGIGLAMIFFYVLYRRYMEYVYAKKKPKGTTDGISHKNILKRFLPYTRKTIYFCLIFFVLVPALIYLLSYIPFRDYSDRGLVDRMIQNQNTMFGYHSTLESTHDFSSVWYEWPVLKRPIWFHSHIVTTTLLGGLREGISSFGNPAVWWTGIPAALFMAYLWARKKDRTAAFLVVGYLAQYLPWFFVSRITFIYHYFPSVPFVVLMITYGLGQWDRRLAACPEKSRAVKGEKAAFYATAALYGALAFGLFLLFYPVLSGQPVEAYYVSKYLRWFKTWVLTAKANASPAYIHILFNTARSLGM